MAEAQITTDGIEETLSVAPIIPTECDSNLSHQEMVHMVQYMAKAMQKNHHLQMLTRLPPDVRRRLRALRKLQLQTNNIEMEFHRKEFELEKEFQVKHSAILKKRFDIVSGEYEPIDEECDYPDPDLLQRIDENISLFTHINVNVAEGCATPIKGIPNFWLHILYSNAMLDFLLHDGDEDILNHLIDIRTTYKSEPHFSFILEFEFSENPFFENAILTKEYLLKMKFNDVLLYEGPEICKTIGCDIKWKSEKTPGHPSFLDFFNPPVLPTDAMDPSYEDIKNVLESDFEIGNYIKDHIIPKATLCYTGEFHDGCEECDSDSGAEEGHEYDLDDEKFEG